MDNRTNAWIILILALFLTTFDFYWCLRLFISLFTFLVGLVSLLYIQKGDVEKFCSNCAETPKKKTEEEKKVEASECGLQEVVRRATIPKNVQKTDSRVTGSELIDSPLQEILGYIIRDYVTPWYNLISSDDEFSQTSVRKTAQSLAIKISNKVKEVDWIPFLTTKLVDHATTHLRLFKQARAKMKAAEKERSPRNSPRKEVKVSPKRAHKRNKSETDINRLFGSKTVIDRKDIERNIGNSKFYTQDPTKKMLCLEDYFFDLECTMENNIVCRDLVCMDSSREKEFLSELLEVLLYVLMDDEDFKCKPLRYILRELFANCVILPVFTMITDPDYINQAIIWLCLRDLTLPSEIFLTALRLTDNCDELKCTKDLVSKEIQLLRSRDSGGESDLSIKQQLSSLSYVVKLIDNRLSKLDSSEMTDSNNIIDYNSPLENVQLVQLSLDFILKNNVALSYFIDYVSSHGIKSYLFFYLNIEGWKISVEQQLFDMNLNKIKGLDDNSASVYENIRSTALSIYDQYFGDKREQIIDINSGLIHKLFFRIRNLTEQPSDLWFDDIKLAVYEKMEASEEFLPAFKQSHAYVKLLGELDLLQQATEDDVVSLNSLESYEDELPKNSTNENTNTFKSLKFVSSESFLSTDSCEKNMKHVRSFSDVSDFMTKGGNVLEETSQAPNAVGKTNDVPAPDGKDPKGEDVSSFDERKSDKKHLKSGAFTLQVNIIETGIMSEKGKEFGVYAIRVGRRYESGSLEEWHIYRRYRDFHDLQTKVKDKFPDLSKLTFPGKKTFHNMDRSVLERRMRMLGCYMHLLCEDGVINSHHGLKDLLMSFLEQGEYDRATSGGPISHTIDSLVNPLKSGMKTIKNMPEQIFNTVELFGEGINKVFHTKQGQEKRDKEAGKISAGPLDTESDDNIPLRIMLLLMDEVFDLKSRNQWLRRRIVTLLRQIVRTMFGDIVNRRILDYVSFITSPKNVAYYLHTFKHSFWPNGVKAERKAERDDDIKYRTRLAAKIALLSCLSDELKHIIGSETTRKGLLTIFELFQRPVLNRRLLYVLLEGIICTLFPKNNMPDIFQKLHSKSKRYQDKQKELNTHKPR